MNFNTNNTNSDLILNLIENWQDWNISTMSLLIWLNILSNRSFNDLSQYPVFPWILTQYQDKFIHNGELSLSKSYMPDTISKSNSGDTKSTKTKTGSFFTNLAKKKFHMI